MFMTPIMCEIHLIFNVQERNINFLLLCCSIFFPIDNINAIRRWRKFLFIDFPSREQMSGKSEHGLKFYVALWRSWTKFFNFIFTLMGKFKCVIKCEDFFAKFHSECASCAWKAQKGLMVILVLWTISLWEPLLETNSFEFATLFVEKKMFIEHTNIQCFIKFSISSIPIFHFCWFSGI